MKKPIEQKKKTKEMLRKRNNIQKYNQKLKLNYINSNKKNKNKNNNKNNENNCKTS